MAKKEETQMAASDFNLEKIKTKELSEHVAASIEMQSNIAVFGRRGSGKSIICKDEIANSGMREAYINISVLERVDLGGFPKIMNADPRQKFVEYLLPQFLAPMMEGTKGVVALLDEVDKADPSLNAPLLEFTQFHSINGIKLPNLRSVIMTGNLISEGGARPSVPLLDRTEKYLLEADAASWLEWAGKKGNIHPSITSFINDNTTELFGAVDPEDRFADASPRGWEASSDILWKGEEKKWSPDLLLKKVGGRIGKQTALKYKMYYEHYQQLIPMIDDLFHGREIIAKYNTLEPTKKLVACMIACSRLCCQIDNLKDKKALPNSVSYVGRFLSNVTHENMVIAVRSQLTLPRLITFNIDEHPDWKVVIAKANKKAGI
jgi:hypothetical protein